ncbi:MAG: hypothetical protein F6K35_48355, partial [Okeania sp. SIO2H7]|nr:hypothetical protein [Okeania sp. SIO2H7]
MNGFPDFCRELPGLMYLDGKLIEKHAIALEKIESLESSNMTAKTRRIQSRLDYYWRSFMMSGEEGGEVYVEISCRTVGRARTPNIAYITPEL